MSFCPFRIRVLFFYRGSVGLEGIQNFLGGIGCRKVSLVKSDKDNRYSESAVVSHDGVQMPCVAVPCLASFREHVGEEEYRQVGNSVFQYLNIQFFLFTSLTYIRLDDYMMIRSN